jgi:ADP-heptose:LPS heptosyltransferase
MKILIIRLSALGDVAMTIPVITSFAQQYPEIEITFLSKASVEPLFEHMPSNFHFRGLKENEYANVFSLFRLFCSLKKEKFNLVADLHNVLRTKMLRILFQLTGKQTKHIDKGRKDKRRLVRKEHKIMKQLPSSFARYEKVFEELGYPIKTSFHSIFGDGKGDLKKFVHFTGVPNDKFWIGIAPFAAHKGKRLPEESVVKLIKQLSLHPKYQIFLFGGVLEKEILDEWSSAYPNVASLAGSLTLNEELALMSYLRVMISMDSANMHLASLVGTPVVSIWGATHYFAGFMGWMQDTQNAVETDLPCRPCSIFGNKDCYRKDYACLQRISPEMIITKIEKIVN